MSMGYASWNQYTIIFSELDVLTETTILVWLCRRFSAEWVLDCLELGLLFVICFLLILIGVVLFMLACLCRMNKRSVYGEGRDPLVRMLNGVGENLYLADTIYYNEIEDNERSQRITWERYFKDVGS